ncbi:hypothetical protein BLA29_006093, partial [Euroglyphus maynei]
RDLLIHERFLQPLNEQIEKLQQFIANQRNETLKDLKSKKSQLLKLMKKNADEKKSRLERLEPLKQELTDLTFTQNKIMSQLTVLQKESISLKNDVKDMENRLDLFGSVMTTKHSIEQVLETFRSKLNIGDDVDEEERQHAERIINGYHGQVIDFVDLIKPVNYAMEVLLKNNLFYHVVSDEKIAIELLDEISRLKLPGSFNFIAANRLPSSSTTNESSIERGLDNLCEPLFNCIRNKDPNNVEIENVLRHIFSGLYIGRSFHDCWTLFQKSRYCDFATLDGEMINGSGVIQKVKQNHSTKFELYQTLSANEKRLKEIREQIERLESDRDQILNENLEAHRQEILKSQELSSLQDWFHKQNEIELDSNESVLAEKLEQIDAQIELERNCLCSNETRLSCLIEEKNFWQQKSQSD